MDTGHALVDELATLHLEGHVVPWRWFGVLCFANGKPDMNSIMILADVVYWYRPAVVRDEDTGQVIDVKKRFKADLLQRSYQAWADQFGMSKRQATDALARLEHEYRVIRRHFRTVDTPNGRLANVLFIEPVPGRIRMITHQRDTSHVETGDPLSRFNVTPLTFQRDTDPVITTAITEEEDPPSSPPRGEGVSVHASPGKKEKHRKTPLPDDPAEQDRLYTAICDQALRLWCAAKALALNLDEQWEAFVRDARAHARTYADWRAAFQNWLTSPYRVAAVARGPSDPAAERAARNREESRLFLERVKHGTA